MTTKSPFTANARIFKDPQVLLIDADDTLWENQAYFEAGLRRFEDIVREEGGDPEKARGLLRADELVRIPREGYGSRRFAKSLQATVHQLLGPTKASALEAALQEIGEVIFHQPVDPFPGVRETLESLRERHQLILVTKGSAEEQAGKIERSGLKPLFAALHILHDKTAEAFDALARSLPGERTRKWMIGNSPRSDINPAIAAGLRTVFIPHHTLWEHEYATLSREPDLVLRRFEQLRQHF